MEETNENIVEEELKQQDSKTHETELETTKKELEETTDRLKRLMAEFENFKKRSTKEREAMYNSILSDVIASILPAIDNLDKAVLVETQDTQYKQGVELVAKQLQDVLSGFGVKKIETVRPNFRPRIS